MMSLQETTNLLEIAMIAAELASNECYKNLVETGPRYNIRNADLFGEVSGPVVGTMLDLCGSAWIVLNGNQNFVRDLKKIGNKRLDWIEGTGWRLRKSVDSGYILHLSYSKSMRQESSVHSAAYYSAMKILDTAGVKGHVHTHIV
jgi:hypothetical protein